MSMVCSVSVFSRAERVAQRGCVERRAGLGDQLLGERLRILPARLPAASAPGLPAARSAMASGSKARSSAPASVAGVCPPEAVGDLLALRGFELAVEPGEARGQRGERVFIAFAGKRHAEQSLSSGTVGWRSSGRDSVLSLSHTPTASTMTKWVLARASSPETACRSVGGEHARAAAFHLLEIDAAADVAQEDEALRAA